MSLAGLRERMKRFDKNAEVIFDREEPVGAPTDMVMPRRRWFGKKGDRTSTPAASGPHPNLLPAGEGTASLPRERRTRSASEGNAVRDADDHPFHPGSNRS